MAFKITITEDEIKQYPNDYELGNFIRTKYNEYSNIRYDVCVECGLESPYTIDTHIDYRVGFIEGAGQGCFQKENCKK
jgi:hypothetical protein